MDFNAIGDSTDKLKGVRILSLDDIDDEEVLIDNEFEEDYDSNDEEEEDPVTKPKNKWSLQRQYFPSKAGGAPAWLDPINIPPGRSYACVTYVESFFFRDQHEQWKRHPEKPSRSVKVFRCQLPRDNPFYSSERPKYDGSDKPVGSGASLCDWCGSWRGDKLCSSFRQVRYCSEKHQVKHWRSGHKIACPQVKISSDTATLGPNNGRTISMKTKMLATFCGPNLR